MYITQLIYFREGQENVFDQFESIAIPSIVKYNGKLVLRVRPSIEDYIEYHMERPYEIHLISFVSVEDFEQFKQDEERKKFIHLKEQSIKESVLIQGYPV